MKPYHNTKNMNFKEKERFETHNSREYQDLGQQQRIENIHLEKDDLRYTRRMMETHNNKSISIGATVTNTLRCKKDAITRLKKYVGTAEKQADNDVDGATLQAQKFDWTPCRYNVLGWKYQERGTF